MTLAKTQYKEYDNELTSTDDIFYSQLTREEKIEYNELLINSFKGYQASYRGEIYLHNFRRERNYPDKELYKDFSYYNYPHWDNVVQLNKDIEELELKNWHLKYNKKKGKNE